MVTMYKAHCITHFILNVVGNNMIKARITLLALLILSISTVFGQSESDSVDLKEFWNESVEPLIQKDKEKLKGIVEFPLRGEWGFMMGLKKDEKEWTQSDFFENYDKLFDDKILRLLKELNYQDVEVFESEILVGIGWTEEGFESGIIFRYKQIDGQWKLYVIQGVG